MERVLADFLAKEFNLTIVDKLETIAKTRLKEHIRQTILKTYHYPHLDLLNTMIDVAIEKFEDTLCAINYISDIVYAINDTFYENLKEDILHNQSSLAECITMQYLDGIGKFVHNFRNSDDWKLHPWHHDFTLELQRKLDAFYKHKNIDKKAFVQNLLTSETFDICNPKLIENPTPLTPRETILVEAFTHLGFSKYFEYELPGEIAQHYNIANNAPHVNQKILDDSYAVVIQELEKISIKEEIFYLIQREQSMHNELFTNGKRFSKLKTNNHYMSFLYACTSVYTDSNTIVFKEFVEALISGYIQSLEFKDGDNKIKGFTKDLEVLTRYNDLKENDENIKKLENQINFLSITKPLQKLIPFKELANRLELDRHQISNYIIMYASKKKVHKDTIEKYFDDLKTIPIEINISTF